MYLLVFDKNSIQEFAREKYAPKSSFKNHGYFNYTSMGVLIGSDKGDNEPSFSILMEHNYKVDSSFSAGIVTGMEWFDVSSVIPLGGNIKFTYSGSSNMFHYLGASLGYSVPLESRVWDYSVIENKGGWFGNVELGVVVAAKGNTNFFVALGYRKQSLSFTYDDWNRSGVERTVHYNRIVLRIGICMH